MRMPGTGSGQRRSTLCNCSALDPARRHWSLSASSPGWLIWDTLKPGTKTSHGSWLLRAPTPDAARHNRVSPASRSRCRSRSRGHAAWAAFSNLCVELIHEPLSLDRRPGSIPAIGFAATPVIEMELDPPEQVQRTHY